jgi:acylphosphatase
MDKYVRVMISGRVQGVGFRAWTEREARTRELAGFVRNRLNGDVEAFFRGTAQAVDSMCEACWQGPQLARVDRVEITIVASGTLSEEDMPAGFRQSATA